MKAQLLTKGNVLLSHLITLGPVIYGVKPIHLLCFSKGKESATKLLDAYNMFCKGINGIRIKEIYCDNGAYKLLFYNPKLIGRLLDKNENIEFLRNMGHENFQEGYYVEFFTKEMKSGRMPHEIGLFFGYPLKDVEGFIGLSNMSRIATCGWQVYGDKAPSEKIYISFLDAKIKMKNRIASLQRKADSEKKNILRNKLDLV